MKIYNIICKKVEGCTHFCEILYFSMQGKNNNENFCFQNKSQYKFGKDANLDATQSAGV